YAVVWSENAAIHFCSGTGEPAGVHLFIWVKDVDRLFDDLKKRGGTPISPPATQPYGIRECSFRDPNNVTLIFGQDDEPQG
ncbi:MAG TPA: VOC family protein, partial [Kofleriaceae bacterium]|nr:VOC family protein [Kofleriaceae bacterium]